MDKLKSLSTKQIVLIILSVCLCAAAVVTAICLTVEKPFERKNGMTVTEDSCAVFSDDVKIAFADSNVQKNFKDVYIDESGIYTLKYKKELPEFFKGLKKGEVFCVYPDAESDKSYFNMGFCGKLTEDPGQNEVVFEIPQIYEVFKKLKLESGGTNFQSAAFYPEEGVELQSLSVVQPGSSEKVERTVNLAGTNVTFTSKENDKVPIKEDYQILCKQLKVKIKQKIDSNFNISGSVTLDYPSIKFLLDYDYDEATEELDVNDYSFDFVTKEKVDLKIKGSKSVEPEGEKDTIDKITPVNIIDVTESEDDKCVLGTYLIGYNIKLPDENLNNKANDVSYLSMGIAVQLAVTAKGEITIESASAQSGFLSVHADKSGEVEYTVKGYEYPHPVIDSAEPDGSREQEIPFVTSSCAGSMDFKAGVSVDVGICVLGMIPMKLCNGIETEMKADFNSNQTDEIKIVEKSYITNHDIDYLKIDLYSDLKLHLGVNAKKMNNFVNSEVGAVIQVFRKNLIQLPNPLKFDLSQCRFAGIQLGETYSDEKMKQALSEYAFDCDGYNYADYTTDIAVAKMVSEVLSTFDVSVDEILEEFDLEIPDCKITYYSSGAIFVRDESDKVRAIILLKNKIRNDAGLRVGLGLSGIEQIYSAPSSKVSADYSFGPLLCDILDLKRDYVSLQTSTYKSKSDNVKMEILSESETAKVIILQQGKKA